MGMGGTGGWSNTRTHIYFLKSYPYPPPYPLGFKNSLPYPYPLDTTDTSGTYIVTTLIP